MSKLSYKNRIEMYNERKAGETINNLHIKYGITIHNVQYLIRLIDKHGFDILRRDKNKKYSKYFKENAINRVLIDGEAIQSVSIDIGLLSDGMLRNWILKYKENGYNIVERKRGRPTMTKITKKKGKETKDETIKRLKEENLYLKAELEYSKKLRAVVQARKNRQQKKK